MLDLWRASPPDGRGDISPYIRLLLPQESHRTFQLRATKLAQHLSNAVSRASVKASLINYAKQAAGGDFGLAVEKNIDAAGEQSLFPRYDGGVSSDDIQRAMKAAGPRGILTVSDVDGMLDELHQISLTSKSRDKGAQREAVLRRAVRAMAPWELKWFVNLLIRETNIKMDYRSILPALHPDALTVFQSNTDLDEVCQSELLRDPSRRAFSSVKPFNLIMPMLAERLHQKRNRTQEETMKRACAYFTTSPDVGVSGETDEFGAAFGRGSAIGWSERGAGPVRDDDDDDTVRRLTADSLKLRFQGGFFVEDKLDGHRLHVHKSTPTPMVPAAGGSSSREGKNGNGSGSAAKRAGNPVMAAGHGVRADILCLSRMRQEEGTFCKVLEDNFRTCVRAADAVLDGELMVVDSTGQAVDKQKMRTVATAELAALREIRRGGMVPQSMPSGLKHGNNMLQSGSGSVPASGSGAESRPSPWAKRRSHHVAPSSDGPDGGCFPVNPLDDDWVQLRQRLAAGERDGGTRRGSSRPGSEGLRLADMFNDGGGGLRLGDDDDDDNSDADGDDDDDGGGRTAGQTEAQMLADFHLEYVAFDLLFIDRWDEARMKRELSASLLAQLNLLRKTIGPMKGQLPSGDLTRLPQWQRMILLRAALQPLPGRVQLHPATWVSARAPPEVLARVPAGASDLDIMGAHLTSLFDAASDARLEGIMLKRADATYELGERSKMWQKLKPEYVEGAMDTLDLAVLGACYSDGKTAGRRGLTGLTHFIVGCRIEGPGQPLQFAPCGRVGTGYTFAELKDIQVRLQRCMVQRVLPPGAKRSGLQGSADLPRELFGRSCFTADHQPDYYVRPDAIHRTVVMEVMATQVRPSDEFSSGFTMLFPRVQTVRRPVADSSGPADSTDAAGISATARSGAVSGAGGSGSRGGSGGLDVSLQLLGLRDPRDKGPSQCTHVDELHRILRDRNGLLRSDEKAKALIAGGEAASAMQGTYKARKRGKRGRAPRRGGFTTMTSFGIAGSNVPMLNTGVDPGASRSSGVVLPFEGISLFVQQHGGSTAEAATANDTARSLVGELGANLVRAESAARYVVFVNPRDAASAAILGDATRLYSAARAKATGRRGNAARRKDEDVRSRLLEDIDAAEGEICCRDYVRTSWLQACAAAGEIVPIRWEHVLLPSFHTRHELTMISDSFQDYYEEDASPESLSRSLREVERQSQALARTGRKGAYAPNAAAKRRKLELSEDADVSLIAAMDTLRTAASQDAGRFDVALAPMLASASDDDAQRADEDTTSSDLDVFTKGGLTMTWVPRSLVPTIGKIFSAGKPRTRSGARSQIGGGSGAHQSGSAAGRVRLVVWFDDCRSVGTDGTTGSSNESAEMAAPGGMVTSRTAAWRQTQMAEVDCARVWLQSHGAAIARSSDDESIVIEVVMPWQNLGDDPIGHPMAASGSGHQSAGGHGAPHRLVVSLAWVDACKEKGQFVDPARFVVQSASHSSGREAESDDDEGERRDEDS